ncbi:MAG: hypothetical protein M1837_000483 [Sclerophora amabilis]|nr:MAG: hypothetical protein M1837_000483 [Sclerophora amabilis]
MALPVSRPLLHGEITYSEAKDVDTDILKQLTYVDAREKFFIYLAEHRYEILVIVARHLQLHKTETGSIDFPRMTEWLHGSFNVGLPITVHGRYGSPGRRVLIRFPLPYKIGEAFRPGNVDEKLRCEAATYAWVDQNCRDIPIPHLWGFALSNGRTFSALEHVPFFKRWLQYIRRRFLRFFGFSDGIQSQYIPLSDMHALGVGYLLTDFIETGRMLTATWEESRSDKLLRANLFRDLSRIMLSLGSIPLPRIGSFTLDDHGFLSLTNRPLTLDLHQMENENIPIDIPRELTYATTESYVVDLLHCHRTRIIHQPNSIHDEKDGLYQVSAMTAMGAVPVFEHFFDRCLRNGPFALTLTDLHHSNIFVDENWHITHLVDLEWACARPVEMQHPPYWLTDQSVDTINIDAYNPIHREFLDIFQKEEALRHLTLNNHDTGNNIPRQTDTEWTDTRRTDVMRRGWKNGTFWYSLALDSPTGLPHLLYKHIQPIFRTHGDDAAFFSTMSQYWMPGLWTFLDAKVEEKRAYEARLREVFDVSER